MAEQITTAEALHALPVGSVVRNHSRGIVAERTAEDAGIVPGSARSAPWADFWSPGSLITVLYRPDAPV
ncbi:hypothetical protein, partial [Cellulomonas sp. HZM]|uniref:hypothetical protein n=1 Tax=Cellulomonas sp. HZM TaxID=1454010 RepID=UPI000557F6D0